MTRPGHCAWLAFVRNHPERTVWAIEVDGLADCRAVRYRIRGPHEKLVPCPGGPRTMNSSNLLLAAAIAAFAVGVAHSVLGEKYILMRLFRRPGLPELFGGTTFTVRTLRFAWHVTTLAWWGFGAMLVLASRDTLSPANSLRVIGFTMFGTGIAILVASRGRHLAWPVFAAIGIIALRAGF